MPEQGDPNPPPPLLPTPPRPITAKKQEDFSKKGQKLTPAPAGERREAIPPQGVPFPHILQVEVKNFFLAPEYLSKTRER